MVRHTGTVTPRKVPADEQLREAFGEVGEALQRALVLSTDRIQSVLEDAVVRGRMTRRDAEELASNLASLGRDQAAELRDEFDQLVSSLPGVLADVADAVDPRGKKRRQDAANANSEVAAEAAALVDDGAPPAAKKPAAKPKPAPAPSTAPGVHIAEPVKQGAGPVPSAKRQAATSKPATKKPATKSAATKAKSATKKPAAKKPAAKSATKPAAAKKPAAKPKPAPAPSTATTARVAEPLKQGAGPTPSPAPNAASATVRELLESIPKLTKTELSELRAQEAAGKNRKTVLAAIEKAQA